MSKDSIDTKSNIDFGTIKAARERINKLISEGNDTNTNPNQIAKYWENKYLNILNKIEYLNLLYTFNQISYEECKKIENETLEKPIWKTPTLIELPNKSIFLTIKEIYDNPVGFGQKTIKFLNIAGQNIKTLFWNSTFPNLFQGFSTDEACEKSFMFLKEIYSNKEINSFQYFIDGSISFIFHNYLFQKYFLSNLYEELPNNLTLKHVEVSFIKSMLKLSIHQNNILKLLIKGDDTETEEMKLEGRKSVIKLIHQLLECYQFTIEFNFSLQKFEQTKTQLLSILEKLEKGEDPRSLNDFCNAILAVCERDETAFCIPLNNFFSQKQFTKLTHTDIQIIANITESDASEINIEKRDIFYDLSTTLFSYDIKNNPLIPKLKKAENEAALYDWKKIQNQWEMQGINSNNKLLKEKLENDIDPKIIYYGMLDLENSLLQLKAFKSNLSQHILSYQLFHEYYKSLERSLQMLCNLYANELCNKLKNKTDFSSQLFYIYQQNIESNLLIHLNAKYNHLQSSDQYNRESLPDTIDQYKIIFKEKDKEKHIEKLYTQMMNTIQLNRFVVSDSDHESFKLMNIFLETYSRSFLLSFTLHASFSENATNLNLQHTFDQILETDYSDEDFLNCLQYSPILLFVQKIMTLFDLKEPELESFESFNRAILFEFIPIINQMIHNFIGSERNKTAFYEIQINSEEDINQYVQQIFQIGINEVVKDETKSQSILHSFLECFERSYQQIIQYTNEMHVTTIFDLKDEFENFKQYFLRNSLESMSNTP